MRIFITLFLALNLTFGANMGAKENLDFVEVNGAKIPLIYELSNALPLGNISIIFYGGGKVYENKVALSAFSADLLNRGSKKSGEIDFADKLESNAISLGVASGLESLTFELSFLSEKREIAFELLSELLQSPNFTSDAFNQSQIALKSELLAKENNFDYIAGKNLNALIFKGTPLENPALGEISDIEKIKLSDVESFVKNALTLENAVILVGGDFALESIKKDLTKLLSILPKGQKIKRTKFAPSDKAQTITAKKPTKQAYIYFASPFKFDSYEKDLHKMTLMSFIMGSSGFGSRVMEEIRVKRGLAYSAYFYASVNSVTAQSAGYLQTKLENKDTAINALREIIANFIKKGVTQKELDDAKSYILGSRVLSNETLNQRLNKKFRNFSRDLPLNYDEILVQKIKNLTLGELNAYIKAHSEVNNLSFSVVVDK
ncbi:M16 family metallopeptidase [Helicobacter sp. 23-1044]